MAEGIAPDLIGAVVGFRQFAVRDGELWSVLAPYRWTPGAHTAVCLAQVSHDEPVPAKHCTCGFYVRYTPPPRGASLTTPDLVAGGMAVWGRIELHAHGMRAEHAAVVALALPFSYGRKRRDLLLAAESLAVPAVPARRLVAVATKHGEMIPRRMRPPDLAPNKRAAPGEPAPARLNAVADGLRQPPKTRTRHGLSSAESPTPPDPGHRSEA
jgi:hypothetical protein